MKSTMKNTKNCIHMFKPSDYEMIFNNDALDYMERTIDFIDEKYDAT